MEEELRLEVTRLKNVEQELNQRIAELELEVEELLEELEAIIPA